MPKKGLFKKCKHCGEMFYEFPYLKGKRRFCSTNCANKANAGKNSQSKMGSKNPMWNKRPWNWKLYSKKQITKKEQKKWNEIDRGEKWGKFGFKKGNKTKSQFKKGHIGLVGNLNPAWQGGISKEPYSQNWNGKLKEKIKMRDNFTCQKCGIKITESRRIKINPSKEWLTVHHKDYNKKNCEENNLITLCHKCNCLVNRNRNYWTKYFNKFNK